MSHHALLEYIRKAKTCGATHQEISERLHTAGWYRVDIQDGLELYERLTHPTLTQADCDPLPGAPGPSVIERIVPRIYDPAVVAVAVLSFAVCFIAYMWFSQ
jgi:hypothetical protein